ncbi:Connector enhancer of kinase suppressor of ras 2 [Operophtera brumata]|uniref:Connector enhancer of kinase suppressor of ras 2 n=1 Tax=Operophtera brumata TaxID=104452 RepID=A0A0L7KTB7_OPEBR|nr:Connector enhancer of kinase suppressor of ras 2 [Operophtera brumata]
MSGLNVAEWSPDQVADWLSGLGPTVAQYVPALRARGLDGPKLLMMRCDDLEYLGMHIIGHQELLLEAVEHLRNFQYELSRECIQQLALKVSVVATTLARQLRHHTDARLDTQILADVARTVHAVKPLVCWLDRQQS